MNDLELTENFVFACLKYAIDHGGVTTNFLTFSPDIIGLELTNQTISISRWGHASPQPSITQLKRYTVDDLVEVIEVYNIMLVFQTSPVAITTSSNVQTILNYVGYGCKTGSLLLNIHTNQLMVFYGSVWLPVLNTPSVVPCPPSHTPPGPQGSCGGPGSITNGPTGCSNGPTGSGPTGPHR